MINYLKQFEDYNIKDILIQEFQGTRAIKLKLKSTKSQKKNTHKIPQYTIVKPHVRAVMKTKDCCEKKGGSTNYLHMLGKFEVTGGARNCKQTWDKY